MSLRDYLGALDAIGASAERNSSRVSEAVDEIAEDVRRAQTAILTVVPAAKPSSLRASGTSGTLAPLIPEVLAPDSPSSGPDRKTAIFDDEDDLATYVARQGDKIRDILGTDAGRWLEEYARIFQYLRSNRFTSAEGLQLVEDFKRQLEFFKKLVQQFGGVSGRQLSFPQFQRDLENALRKQVTTSVKAAIPSGSSGTLGRNPDKPCASPSLAILAAAGVLR